MKREVRDCDRCGKPALLTVEIQGRMYDLCSRQCGHEILDEDFDKQQHPQSNVVRLERKGMK